MTKYLYSFVVMARKGFYSFAPITPDATDYVTHITVHAVGKGGTSDEEYRNIIK